MPTKLLEAVKTIENGDYRYDVSPFVNNRMVVGHQWEEVESQGLVGYTVQLKIASRIFIRPGVQSLQEAVKQVSRYIARQVYGDVIENLIEVNILLHEQDVRAAQEKLQETIRMMEV